MVSCVIAPIRIVCYIRGHCANPLKRFGAGYQPRFAGAFSLEIEMMEKPKISDSDAIGGWTIAEWCSRWRISRGTYYKLRRKGRGPQILLIESGPRITPAADAEWQRQQTLDH